MGQFSSWGDFFAMGGYGFYVWLAFGSSLLLMLLMIVVSRIQKKRLLNRVLIEQARRERIAKAREIKV